MLTLPDHLFAFLIGIVLPLHGFPTWQRLRRDAEAGRTGARIRLYVRTFIIEWLLAFCVLGLWSRQHRPIAQVGIDENASTPFILIFVISALLSLILVIQWMRVVLGHGKFPAAAREQLGNLIGIIPQTRSERRWFALLSITSGICEELLYRGFLMWYLGFHFDRIVAALIALVLFTIGHGYQGATGLKKTFAAGGVLTIFYLVSGSLIPSMLLHATVNMTSGLIGSEILRNSQDTA